MPSFLLGRTQLCDLPLVAGRCCDTRLRQGDSALAGVAAPYRLSAERATFPRFKVRWKPGCLGPGPDSRGGRLYSVPHPPCCRSLQLRVSLNLSFAALLVVLFPRPTLTCFAASIPAHFFIALFRFWVLPRSWVPWPLASRVRRDPMVRPSVILLYWTGPVRLGCRLALLFIASRDITPICHP